MRRSMQSLQKFHRRRVRNPSLDSRQPPLSPAGPARLAAPVLEKIRDSFGNRRLPLKTCAKCVGSSGDFLPPSPPAEKATAREDQARQSSADNGARNRRGVVATLHLK
jgi:hypothetical protein